MIDWIVHSIPLGNRQIVERLIFMDYEDIHAWYESEKIPTRHQYRLAVPALPFSVKFTLIFGNCTPLWEYRENGTLCIRFTYELFIFSCFSHWNTACTTESDENIMRIYHVLGWYTAKFTFFLFPSSCASHCLFFHLSLLRFIESELFKVMFQIYP